MGLWNYYGFCFSILSIDAIRKEGIMRTKICGIRNYEDAMVAIKAGANAVGFLVGITHVAEDKIDKEEAFGIIRRLPPFVSTVLVTHLTDRSEIVELAKYLTVTTIQIHDYISPEDVQYVREKIPYCKIIKAVHVLDEIEALGMVRSFQQCCDALLLDSRTKERLGGTGLTHDWNISRKIVLESNIPVILAGGLTAENTYDAVKKVHPYGVDVNSGVETDGFKSYEKVRAFIYNAKKAEEEYL